MKTHKVCFEFATLEA